MKVDILLNEEDNLSRMGDGWFDSRLRYDARNPGLQQAGPRRRELTLAHLNRLKKIRRRRKAENTKHADFIAAIYQIGKDSDN